MHRFVMIVLTTSQFLLALTNYYVDNSLNANGDGSFTSPFNQISYGMSKLQPGDTLFIRGSQSGDAQIYNEKLYLGDGAQSGLPGQEIVVKAFENEQVRIILETSFKVYASYWTFENLIFDLDGKDYDLIKLKGDHVTFRGCEITNGQKDGFDISRASNTLIENCKIHNFIRSDQYDAHGIILNGGVDNIIRNNEIFDCKGDCIQLYKADQNYGTLIEGNDLYTTLGNNSENAIDVKAARNLRIINNKMHGFHVSEGSDGVAVKINKDSDDILVFGNDIYESNGGIRVTGGDVDTIRIERNVIHNLHADNGLTYKYGYGIQFGGVNNVILINNTIANTEGPLFWIDSKGVDNLIMKNNLFYKTNKFKGSTNDFRGTVTIDYNGWFQCAETIPSEHQVVGDDPKFVDEQNYDYHLRDGSPAIDAGDPADGTNYPGGRIDLGAYEFEPTTGLDQVPPKAPEDLRIFNCYPNPFNPDTILEYVLLRPSSVQLDIFNILGKKIATLFKGIEKSGKHRKYWHPKNLPAGIYFARLQINQKAHLKSLIYLK